MLATISQTEQALLEDLYVHAGIAGERISLDPKPIRRRLRVSADQFARDLTSLAAQGLAGVRTCRPDANDVPSPVCSAVWLTGRGEDYVRESHRAAGLTGARGR